jgi:uncharacterized protein YdcH (DUF465 family)
MEQRIEMQNFSKKKNNENNYVLVNENNENNHKNNELEKFEKLRKLISKLDKNKNKNINITKFSNKSFNFIVNFFEEYIKKQITNREYLNNEKIKNIVEIYKLLPENNKINLILFLINYLYGDIKKVNNISNNRNQLKIGLKTYQQNYKLEIEELVTKTEYKDAMFEYLFKKNNNLTNKIKKYINNKVYLNNEKIQNIVENYELIPENQKIDLILFLIKILYRENIDIKDINRKIS